MPLLSTISRAELDHEATLAATRLGKPFEKPGPNIREGLDYVDISGRRRLTRADCELVRARAKRDHARMTQMELEVGALLVAGAPTEVKNDEGLTPCSRLANTTRGRSAGAHRRRGRVPPGPERAEAAAVAPRGAGELPDAFEVAATRCGRRAWRRAPRGARATATRRHFAAIADAADLIKRAGRFDEFRKSVDVLSSEGDVKTGALHKCAAHMGIWKQ